MVGNTICGYLSNNFKKCGVWFNVRQIKHIHAHQSVAVETIQPGGANLLSIALSAEL